MARTASRVRVGRQLAEGIKRHMPHDVQRIGHVGLDDVVAGIDGVGELIHAVVGLRLLRSWSLPLHLPHAVADEDESGEYRPCSQ